MAWLRFCLRVLLVAGAIRIGFLLFAYFLDRPGVGRHHVESTFFVVFTVALMYLAVLDGSPTRPDRRHDVRWPILLGTAATGVLLLYWPALVIGWLSDDWVLQDWARRGEFIASTHEFVRPLPLLLWRGLFAVGGGAVATHVVNVLLHVISTVFTGLLAHELGAPRQTAWFAAAIFLVWPTQVETVVWAAGVFDALMTTSVLAVVFLYLRWSPEITIQRTAVLVAITTAAFLSKETAVALPALLLVASIPRWARRRSARPEITTFALLATLCTLYLAWRVLVRPHGAGAELPAATRYALKELVSRTFAGLAVPFDADTISSYRVGVAIVASALVFFSVTALVRARQRQPVHVLALQGLAWSLFSTVPALGYLLIGPYLQGSRYLYLAAAGWAWFVAATTETRTPDSQRRDWVQAAILSALVVASVAQDRALVNDWQTAGAMRDALLDQTRGIAARERCGDVRLVNPPPAYKGTQLFLNGFAEAVRATGATTPGGSECLVRWDGTGLRRE